MSRRGRGEGSVYKRKDGLWAAAISLANGHRETYYGKTRREVQDRLAASLANHSRGLPVGTGRESVAAYLRSWLESARPSLRPRTWTRYEQLVRVHIVPAIGRLPLRQLEPQHLRELYAERLAAKCSPTSVHHMAAVTHRALEQAARDGILPRNVASLVRRPRIARREMRTFSPVESRRFLDGVAGDRLQGLYVLALTTGMRQGEILALRWPDIEFERRALSVRATLQRTRGSIVFAAPKTARSRRVVALTHTAIAALRRHRARQLEERLRCPGAWANPDLVFTNEIGQPLHGTYLTKQFQTRLKRAALPRLRFHDLRHTAATLLLGRGVHPKIASEMLGHSSIAITLDLYSHVTPTMQREAVDALDAVFAPS